MPVQVLFFSATFNDKCIKVIKEFYKSAYFIELEKKKEELTLTNVTQYYKDCKTQEDKISFIEEYLNISSGSQRVIIFVNTRKFTVQLQQKLKERGKKVCILMGGDMDPRERDKTIKKFRDGEIQILITTDLLARGYDERSVKLIINFDLPVKKVENRLEPNYETYLHRIGRTGRFGTKGIGVNLCCGIRDMEYLTRIETYYKTKIEKMGTFNELLEQLKKMMQEDS